MPFAKPTKKQLDESNILVVRKKSGKVPQRVVPYHTLRDPIKRYLPPPGKYYDQSTLEGFTNAFNHQKRCVLCWNAKSTGEQCKCEDKCAVCDTKEHRGRECHMIYADANWWRARGHRLRKKAQLRPSPGERAHLVVANVVKDWKKMNSAVFVNMDDPDVRAFYEGKEAPQRLFELPSRLRSIRAATTTAEASSIPLIFEPDAEVTPVLAKIDKIDDTNSSKAIVQSEPIVVSDPITDFISIKPSQTTKTTPQDQIGSLSAEDDDSLLDLLDDTWLPPSYHEGRQYAEMTPLSLRLALASLQEFAVTQQFIANCSNEGSMNQDHQFEARMQTHHETSPSQPRSTDMSVRVCKEAKVDADTESKSVRLELEEAREEIRTKNRRIQELELALHESEGWTDTLTYHIGQKRLRG